MMNGPKLFVALLSLIVIALPGNATTIGPDTFGYFATDSPFHFVDITGTGTRILAASDDDTQTADLGFLFSFYGTEYSQGCISANGLIAFGGCDPSAAHVDLSTTGTFNNLPTIAALWDDWQFFTPGTDAVYLQTTGLPGSQLFIVEWSQAKGNFPYSPGTATFEAILSEGTGNILLQYLNADTQDFRQFGGNSTVGIRDIDGEMSGRNLVWSYNAPALSNATSVLITVTPVPEPGSVWLLLAGGVLLSVNLIRRTL